MTSPQVQELLQKSAAYLKERGIENARRESEWMFSHVLKLSRMELYTRFDMPIEQAEVTILRDAVTRRGQREPLAYILGSQPFRQLELQVSSAVLVPRPETEGLIDLIVAATSAETPRCVDIGTGSGAIALSIKSEHPEWQVAASDVSAEALAVAQANAASLGCEIEWHEGHLLQPHEGQFDHIVANLPYIADSERSLCDPELQFEPSLALFADDEGLFLIKELMQTAQPYLREDGKIWLEHGFQQATAIKEVAEALGYHVQIFQDLAGQDRFTCLSVANGRT